MNLVQVIEMMNQDLSNELKHFNFYLNAYFTLKGFNRLHFGNWLEKQADEELGHIKMFANKIFALGGIPTNEVSYYPVGIHHSADILSYAIDMEKEVVNNYHQRLKQMEEFNKETNKHYDLVLFYEEQIEDSQNDLDEMGKMFL